MRKVTDEELDKALKNEDNINVMNKICMKYMGVIPYEELERCKLISVWQATERREEKPAKLGGFSNLGRVNGLPSIG